MNSLSTYKEGPRFEELPGTSPQLVGVIGVSVIIQLGVWLILFGGTFVPYSPIDFRLFWVSYIGWVVLAFAICIRRDKSIREGRLLHYTFVVLLLTTLIASKYIPFMSSINLSFEGYFLGIGFYIAGVLLKRYV